MRRDMQGIPREKSLDSTVALLSEGYEFIPERCRRHRSDVFQTRLMLRNVVCATGDEAARMFYHPGRFTRRGALPPTALLLLQDRGSVQLRDGDDHSWRKQMFMSLMAPEGIQRLADITAERWRAQMERWQGREEIVLLPEVEEILCRAVCEWTGVPLSEPEAAARTREFAAMIDGAGAVGPRNWRGMLLRARTERWARGVVDRIRTGRLNIPEGTAAHVIAHQRDPGGRLLDTKVAAVELINVLRPTVAVARYITFAALALHDHPEWRLRFRNGEDEALEAFVQEVRRFYPFFPAVGGRAQVAFDWRGHHFARGAWVLLDLYGTDHDARIWTEPDRFRPERFQSWDGSPFNFIPQGGGDHHTGHRCAGEWVTVELVKTAVRLLSREMHYDVPDQDLRINLSRMPAAPSSGFVIRKVVASTAV